MSETEATTGKPLPWTEEAKSQFLLRIIAQLKQDGRTIDWARLNMQGRTTKSLQNMWFKINKEIAALESNGEIGAQTPTKPKATPRKGRKKVEKSESIVAPGASDDDDDYNPDKKVTPKKRGATGGGAPKTPAKKAKQSSSDDERAVKVEAKAEDAFADEDAAI